MICLRQLLSHTSGLAESSGMEEKSSSSLRHYIIEHVCGRNLVQPPLRPVRQEPVTAFAPASALAVSAVDLVKLGLIHVGPGKPEVLPAAYAGQMRQAIPRADPFGLADGWP